jgi:hypothetical protein
MNDNPYQTPESNLETQDDFKRSIWWKIYFFFITILSVLGFTSLLVDPGAGMAEILLILLWVVATTGLFGFVFLKPIYKPRFWLNFLIAYIAFSVIYYFVTNIDMRQGMSDGMFYGSTIFGWLISLPGYFALYAYSKVGRHIQWDA